MRIVERFLQPSIPNAFYWFNEPTRYQVGAGLEITTDEATDFWQTTHYGFQHDNGHCLFTQLSGDFALTTHVVFTPKTQYDQCGLMVRVDEMNWIKMSAEYETPDIARLGSVVTNLGFSDWATQDIDAACREMWYRISRSGQDFLLENSYDGQDWLQMRITHLHQVEDQVDAGVYACSPIGKDFRCRFTVLEISEPRQGDPDVSASHS